MNGFILLRFFSGSASETIRNLSAYDRFIEDLWAKSLLSSSYGFGIEILFWVFYSLKFRMFL